jgi:hypothetical protein
MKAHIQEKKPMISLMEKSKTQTTHKLRKRRLSCRINKRQGNETKDKKIEISSKKEFQLSFGCP